MKKHSFKKHLDSVWEVFWRSNSHAGQEEREWIRFIAYERWLNDRPLMHEEDPE